MRQYEAEYVDDTSYMFLVSNFCHATGRIRKFRKR